MVPHWHDLHLGPLKGPDPGAPKRTKKGLKNHNVGRILAGFWPDVDLIPAGRARKKAGRA